MSPDKKECIFNAAHEVLGERGFHGLSIAEVAKKANVATGTIYRYFADKDDLVRQLHQHTILQCVPMVMADVDVEKVVFQQFRQLWLNIHAIFVNEPNAIKCKLQYESSPLGAELETNPVILAAWEPLDRFFEQGVEQGLFIDLPIRALQVLSLDSVMHLALQCRVHHITLTEAQLETAILASWNAILPPITSTSGACS
ncbi:TetR/AcrR family transcriptional regulator [Aeromonas sp.]|uniref:TetR/AcrR family transcriptional regulator n=1 Tax=Aeromonas sp. TaxID=647 RepID=UPI00258FBA3E|nr:TetR/AcrR family transcriptional regulator [Aeromonas sp.]MCX7130153.1 TetR/AcrR family transcriptional regulator [Aeromonas sp.]